MNVSPKTLPKVDALPEKILALIVDTAWQALPQNTTERWQLYKTLAKVNADFHRLVCHAILRHVVIVCSDETAFEHIRAVEHEWATFQGQTMPSPSSEHGAAARSALFAHSHILLGVPTKVAYPDGHYFPALHRAVPDCTSFTFTSAAPLALAFRFLRHTLFHALAPFPSLTHLHLSLYNPAQSHRDLDHPGPLPLLPHVTSLRLTYFPPACKHARDGECVSTALLLSFPNLVHLALDSPFVLKLLPNPPRTLRTLTIRAQAAQPRASIMGYNVGAALRSGFFAWLPAGARRRIVVRAGAEEPIGWEHAQATCTEFGVELVRVIVD